jgi:hypothetical protein
VISQVAFGEFGLGLGFAKFGELGLGLGFAQCAVLNSSLCLFRSLDPEIWEVRLHFEGVDNLERRIGCDDVTYMNLLVMIEARGYSIRDIIYCRTSAGMKLVEKNETIYDLLVEFEASRVFELTVRKGREGIAKQVKKTKPARSTGPQASSIILHVEPVVYDYSPPVVYSVDDDGQVYSQVGSTAGNESAYPYVCTQQSQNVIH